MIDANLPKILVVDDNPANRQAMQRLFKTSGVQAQCVLAASGNEALALVLEHEFALLLLDVDMPEMDGYEVAEMLKNVECTKNLPIIFVTAAYKDHAHQLKGYDVGAVDYIEKPLNDAILLGKVNIFLKLYNSIVERKRAEAAAKQLNAELEQRVQDRTLQLEAINRELEEFSYSMSHDMRTPLRAIDGFSRILLEEHAGRLDDEAKRLLNALRDNALRMGKLIDDITLFLQMGRRNMKYESVDMAAMVQTTLQTLQNEHADRPVRVLIRNMPLAWGDRDMLRQVWDNLFSNAIKFAQAESDINIEVGSLPDAQALIYYVKDAGVGFDMQYIDKLFRVFERLHSPDQYAGTGMGLAIVKRIIERHGGRIWAESAVNQGASFYFSLPQQGA